MHRPFTGRVRIFLSPSRLSGRVLIRIQLRRQHVVVAVVVLLQEQERRHITLNGERRSIDQQQQGSVCPKNSSRSWPM